VDQRLRAAAASAVGFMPEHEGLALYEAGISVRAPGPFLEIGSYCGKSAVYLGAAARERGTVLFSVDHHRGSEEQQPGEEYFDPRLVDRAGRIDTLPAFRSTIEEAALDDAVVAIVGSSEVVASHWATPLALLFIDGGHSEAAARADYEGWSPHVVAGGLLVIHDVFEDPGRGGRPPWNIYRRAVDSRSFAEEPATDTLRVLKRVE
jgi:predicted O-methyltransferase YrrM